MNIQLYKIIDPLRVSGRTLVPGCDDDALEELNEKQIDRLINRRSVSLSETASGSNKQSKSETVELTVAQRLEKIDGAISGLEAKDYGTEGQPDIRVITDKSGFEPSNDELIAGLQRQNPDAHPGDWGLELRAEAVSTAVKALGEDDFTKTGAPKIPVLQKALGFKLMPDEIKEATKNVGENGKK